MSYRIWLITALLAGFSTFAALPAQAVVIDFGTGGAGAGGVITIVGGNISGSDIPINAVTIAGTSSDGVFNLSGSITCTTIIPGDSDCGSLDFDTGISSNFITVKGAIADLSVAYVTLLSGTIDSFILSGMSLTNAVGPDTKNAELLRVLGIEGLAFNFFGFSLSLDTACPGEVPL